MNKMMFRPVMYGLLSLCALMLCLQAAFTSAQEETPVVEETVEPTMEVTAEATIMPTAEMTVEPTAMPTVEPTPEPDMYHIYLPAIQSPEPGIQFSKCTYVVDGFAMWEAEDVKNDDTQTLSDSWKEGDHFDGYSGDGYIYWTGTSYYGDPNNGNDITYEIYVTKPGLYWFLMNTYHAGAKADENNDIWVYDHEINGYWKFFVPTGHTWTYQSLYEEAHHQAVVADMYFPSEGSYTIRLAPRSNYFYVDTIGLVHIEDKETYLNNGEQDVKDEYSSGQSCVTEIEP